MKQLKNIIKRIIFTVILCSFIISSCAMPASYAKLDLGDGDFYYSGTTKGSYVPQEGIFSWLINLLGELVDWLLGIITMGFRMVIVGYTALAEHWLTNALEIASGVKANGDEVSTTDISTLSDSSNSVTVQGIVYNMIPALDVNFFKIEDEVPYLKEIEVVTDIEYGADGVAKAKTEKKLAVVSPTGLALKCSKCGKPVRDCCTALNSEEGKKGTDVNIPDNPCGTSGEDKCDCGGNCNACKYYAALVQAKDPPVVILKTLIRIWYSIIRLLAAAAMLVLLIFVGIKMATSTVASEKAQYKRMFVDWVVGVILVFGIHYIMVAAVNINEILVEVVRDSANSVNEVQLKELASDKKSVIKTDQEIEINVYDAIKTRAYDAKMTVGFSGMIMYATLVFFSIKYTIIYVKRYLTLAVLTLMGPAVGVAYALQKVLTGKSQSFKLWLSEYILNLIIQVVHALIYAVFISSALALSLKNIAGIIIALILMNFSLKAEKLFRKIFNLDAKGGGLLSATEEAGDINKMEQKIKTAQGMLLGTKPVAKALTAVPLKAVKTIGVAGAAVAGTVLPQVTRAGHSIADYRRRNRAGESTSESNSSSSSSNSSSRPIPPEEEKLREVAEQSSGSKKRREQAGAEEIDVTSAGGATGGEAGTLEDIVTDTEQQDEKEKTTRKTETESEVETKKSEEKKAEESQESQEQKESETTKSEESKESDREAIERLKEQLKMKDQISQITTMDVLKAHVKEAFDINNFYDVSIDENGKVHYGKLKSGLIFGKMTMDPATGYMYRDKSNIASTQILGKLTGFTKEDKKLIKEVLTKSRKAIFGVPLATLGMMTVVAHPAIGLGLLSQGTHTLKALKEFKPVSRFGRFTFKNFASPILEASKYAQLGRENREKARKLLDEKQDKTLKRHPEFVVNLKNNILKPRTIANIGAGALGAVTFGIPGAIIAGAATASVIHSMNQVDRVGYKPSDDRDIRNRNNPYNLIEPVKLYEAQNSSMWGKIEKHHYTQLKNKIAECEQEVFEEIDKATSGQIYDKTQSILEKSIAEIEEKQEIEKWFELGYIYDPKTKQFTKISKDEKSDVKAKDLVKEIPLESTGDPNVQIHKRPMTDVDVAKINREMENIIVEMSNGSQVDMDDEKSVNYVISELSARLEKANILSKGQTAEVLFKENGALKNSIKKKSVMVNKQIAEATKVELDLSQDETKAINEAVNSAVNEEIKNAASATSEIKVEDINEEKIYSSIIGVLQAKSTPQPVEEKKKEKKSKSGEKKDSSTEDKTPKPEEPVAEISPEKEELYRQAIHIMLQNKTNQVNSINVEVSQPVQIRRSTRQQSGKSKVKDSISKLVMKSMEGEPVVPTETEKQEVATKVKKASKKDIKEKIDQIKKIDFDAIDGKLEEAKRKDDDLQIQLLLVKKELSQKAAAINEAAEETLKRKVKRKTKTNALTLEAIRERSAETTKYNELRKRKVNYELQHRIVSEQDTSHLSESSQREYDALKARVESQRTRVEAAESKVIKRQKENGPITDAHKTFNNGLNDFLKKYGD